MDFFVSQSSWHSCSMMLCFRCVTCATWWHGGRKWSTVCATSRRRSSICRYNFWRRKWLEVNGNLTKVQFHPLSMYGVKYCRAVAFEGLRFFFSSSPDMCTPVKIPGQPHIVSNNIQINGAEVSFHFTQMANLDAFCSAALWCRAGRINDGWLMRPGCWDVCWKVDLSL